MVGTPKTIADEMEEWLETKASDGFTIQFPYLPGGLDDFCDQRRAGVAAARPVPHANTKARRCARISACRGRATASSTAKAVAAE